MSMLRQFLRFLLNSPKRLVANNTLLRCAFWGLFRFFQRFRLSFTRLRPPSLGGSLTVAPGPYGSETITHDIPIPTSPEHKMPLPWSTSSYVITPSTIPPGFGMTEPAGMIGYSCSRRSLEDPTAEHHIIEKPASESLNVLDPEGDVASLKTSPTFSHPRIRPFAPEAIRRYSRNVKIPRGLPEYKIPPLTTSFRLENPPGWVACTHPEGALYFYHEDRKVFTDANLYESDLLSQLHADIDTIEDFFRVQNIQRSPHADLVLELLRQEDGQIETTYYLADHSNRCIYFIDEFDASDLPIWGEIQGVTSPSHLAHEIETQYWYVLVAMSFFAYHCLMFPRALELTPDLVNELRDVIMHSMGDCMISPTSTVPYGVDELQKMLSLTNSLRKNIDNPLHGSTCLLSSLMYIFVRQRFYDFHGQPGARMSRDQSVHGNATNKRSWLILSLSPILFYAPEVHLRALEKMWVDGIMRSISWTHFMSKLYTEWQEFTLYATVLLNANVAFLAIQSIDRAGRRSPAQISSYASIVSSIGGIILGLLLIRQNRSKARETAFDAAAFLRRRSSQVLGLETLAIMFSLPYALLMWGMVSFLAAILFMCFEGSDIYTRLLIGATWVALVVLIISCVWMAWEQVQEGENAIYTEEDTGEGKSKNALKAVLRWPRTLVFQRFSCDSDTTAV